MNIVEILFQSPLENRKIRNVVVDIAYAVDSEILRF